MGSVTQRSAGEATFVAILGRRYPERVWTITQCSPQLARGDEATPSSLSGSVALGAQGCRLVAGGPGATDHDHGLEDRWASTTVLPN
jgi:hypothetical protein